MNQQRPQNSDRQTTWGEPIPLDRLQWKPPNPECLQLGTPKRKNQFCGRPAKYYQPNWWGGHRLICADCLARLGNQ